MDLNIISKCINSTGLLFDILGAYLISWEVRNQFKGRRSVIRSKPPIGNLGFGMGYDPSRDKPTEKIEDSPMAKSWETKKYGKIRLGLRLVMVGFALQFLSLWIYEN